MEGTMLLDSSAARVDRASPVVFLDTSVIKGYLRGEAWAVRLLSAEPGQGARFAVNAIVIQELLLTSDQAAAAELYRILENFVVLPIDSRKADSMVSRWRSLDSRSVHVNDVLILSSAEGCRYLVTDDPRRREIFAGVGSAPQLVTARELVTRLQSA